MKKNLIIGSLLAVFLLMMFPLISAMEYDAVEKAHEEQLMELLNVKDIDPEQYLIDQKKFISENHQFDKETGLLIYVPDFEDVLKKIKCPVLALFGEKDSQVNWRKTIKLYNATIGDNLDSKLTIKTVAAQS